MNQVIGKVRFSSKWAMILTCMGMAVGTGNIWRFPVQVAQNGGGSFLIPWFVFLLLWSIPLLMVELAVGQHSRRGPFGAFAKMAGPGFAWMGGFVSICAMMIMCYYAVVTGWTLKYLSLAVQGGLNGITKQGTLDLFNNFRGTPVSLLFHLLAVAIAGIIVFYGTRGIERFNKVLIPLLVAILVFAAINALMLPGSGAGVAYFFNVEPERLTKAPHWIAGLTQSAWSTGAGWGLMLSYAVYARDNEDPITTPMATGVGNNGIELIVGMMIFPAIFALMGASGLADVAGASSKGGIAFQVVPLLFAEMKGPYWLNLMFFIGLASAALTSLIAMIELSTRFFMDFGLTRKKGLAATIGLCILFGSPSALSDRVFDNQDYVWAVGLILSGLFLAGLVIKYGVSRFSNEILNKNSGFLKAGRWFGFLMYLVVAEGLVLLAWWLWQMRKDGMEYLVTCFVQWGLVIGLLVWFRKPLYSRMTAGKAD